MESIVGGTDGSKFTVKVEGPHKEEEPDHKGNLLAQLHGIPRDITRLEIDDDTPSDVEWAILGDHFDGIKDLKIESGFNEELNEKNMPLHWPLECLNFSSACSEVFQSPFVLEGRVKHLILLLTCGLRFEGPTSRELTRAYDEAVERGEEEPEYLTVNKGTAEERKISLTILPELVSKWMNNKYAGEFALTADPALVTEQMKLETLEIIENDAFDTFTRMALALPHLFSNLKTLTLRSTNGCDFQYTPEELFPQIFPHLPTNLETLVLSVADVFHDEQYAARLLEVLPPNITTLRFRGPVSLTESDAWTRWIESVERGETLPNLKKLSFVLDFGRRKPGQDGSESGRIKVNEPDEGALRESKEACNRLYTVVKDRGVVIEPFYDGCVDRCSWLAQVDERWEQL